VLTALGSKTDCVIVHYYPGGSNAAAMLTDPQNISGIVSTIKSEVQQYAGVNPANVPIIVTETNSNVDMDTQPNALFAADMYMTWLENGVTNVDWWDQHNGPGTFTPSVVNGAQDYGDYGIFSSGGNLDASVGGMTAINGAPCAFHRVWRSRISEVNRQTE